MKKRRKRRSIDRGPRREREPLPWRYCLSASLCGLILATGFFYAARQHFFSMDYGIRNSALRGRIDELRSRNRRLLLTREIALTPAEIKSAARKIGLRKMTANNIQIAGADREPADAPTGSPIFERTDDTDGIGDRKPEGKKRGKTRPARNEPNTRDREGSKPVVESPVRKIVLSKAKK